MEPNLPATRDDAAPVGPGADEMDRPPSQPIGVAFLPLALAWFVVLALAIAAWTFIHALG